MSQPLAVAVETEMVTTSVAPSCRCWTSRTAWCTRVRPAPTPSARIRPASVRLIPRWSLSNRAHPNHLSNCRMAWLIADCPTSSSSAALEKLWCLATMAKVVSPWMDGRSLVAGVSISFMHP